jgi:hypothetical protein
MSFGAQIRKHVERLGTSEAARICDVTPRSLQLWMQGESNPNRSTQAGALLLLSQVATPKRKTADAL